MSHIAELIAVGTELLLGNIANTDAQMISQGLSELGIHVYYHTVVGDNPARLRSAVEIARRLAELPPYQPKVTEGYLARYARNVEPAARGAILD